MTRTIINVMLQVLGILAVIMIIVGGIRYTISNGDASRVKAAKDTITYAVVGLIVALLSYAIVNFVIGKF
jgi:glucose uptake protein GlcU